MKRVVISIIASGVLLFSDTINLTPGWKLLGAITDINVTNTFNKNCIDIIWKYNNTSKSWSGYSPTTSIQNIINTNDGISSLISINKGDGYWVKANSSCKIDTNNTLYTIADDPIDQRLSYPGKYPGMVANVAAFAALKTDGSVVTWGNSSYGGDSSAVINKLNNVKAIYSTERAFAALKNDGSVVTWGSSDWGGDSSIVTSKLNNIKSIYSNRGAFAALKMNGTVVTWGILFMQEIVVQLRINLIT